MNPAWKSAVYTSGLVPTSLAEPFKTGSDACPLQPLLSILNPTTAVLKQVLDGILSLLPVVVFHHADSTPAVENITHCFEHVRHPNEEIKINSWPLGRVKTTRLIILQLLSEILEPRPSRRRIGQLPCSVGCLDRYLIHRKLFPQIGEIHADAYCVIDVGGRKKCIEALPLHTTLDSRGKDCRKYCRDSPDCGPSIPPHHTTADAGLHARADSVPQLLQTIHSLIPLWTGRHSAMPMRPEEIARG